MSTDQHQAPGPEATTRPRTLAEELRNRSDADLAHLFSTRPDIATPPPSDMTQVASRATSPRSVALAMDRLDVGRLNVLSAIAALISANGSGGPVPLSEIRARIDAPPSYVDDVVAHLHSIALVWGSPEAYHLVREAHEVVRASELPRGPVVHPPQVRTQQADASRVAGLCAGTAMDLVRRVEQLLAEWADRPPAVLRSGGIGIRDMRAAAQLLDVGPDETEFVVELSRQARLLDRLDDDGIGRVWTATTGFDAWRETSVARRWAVLADAWMQSPGRTVRGLTLDVLDTLTPDAYADPADVVTAVAWLAPRLGEHRDASVLRTLREGAWLGVTAQHALTPAGAAVGARPGTAEPESVLTALLPEPVDHIMLQADLTAIAPGPLEHTLQRRLEQVATIESRGGATVYRFTATSLRAALDRGWTAPEVHELLADLSRTPVPQPLSYLVDDAARQHELQPAGGGDGRPNTDDSPAPRAPTTPVETRTGIDPQAAVAAVRAGEAATHSRPGGEQSPAGAAGTLAALQDASEARASVWLGYMDHTGSRTERLVDPMRVDAGWLTAYDHRSGRLQRFAVHRITRVGRTPGR